MSGVFADHRRNHEDEKSGTRRDSPFFSPTWSEMFLAGSEKIVKSPVSWIFLTCSLRSRRLEVMGERENGSAPVFSCAHYFQAPATQATLHG